MVYASIVDKGVTNSFDDERENYILNKVFDTLFGDMVANIVANILNQEIFIIERPTFSEYRVTVVSPIENNSQIYTNMADESPLVLLKTGLHYDACKGGFRGGRTGRAPPLKFFQIQFFITILYK